MSSLGDDKRLNELLKHAVSLDPFEFARKFKSQCQVINRVVNGKSLKMLYIYVDCWAFVFDFWHHSYEGYQRISMFKKEK